MQRAAGLWFKGLISVAVAFVIARVVLQFTTPKFTSNPDDEAGNIWWVFTSVTWWCLVASVLPSLGWLAVALIRENKRGIGSIVGALGLGVGAIVYFIVTFPRIQ